MHSHDSGLTTHEHGGGENLHRHPELANIAMVELLTNPDPGFVPEPILNWEPTPAPTPNPAPAPPVESDYDRQYRLITEEGNMWKTIGIIAGSIVVGIVVFWFMATVFPAPQIVDAFDNDTVVDNNKVVAGEVVATDSNPVTQAQAQAMIDAAYAKQSTQQTAPLATTAPATTDQPAQAQAPQPIGDPDPASSEQYASSQPQGAAQIFWSPSGKGNTKTFSNVDVPEGYTGVVGGYIVNGTEGGVLRTVAGPAKITTTVTDGFVGVFRDDWVQSWIDKHLEQATREGWAYAVIER